MKSRKFPGTTKRYWLAGSFRSENRAIDFASILVEEGWDAKRTTLREGKKPKGFKHQVWIDTPKFAKAS